MADGSASGYGAMAAAEFARERQEFIWSLNTMSVSSARDRSGEWGRAALNVKGSRVVTKSSEWAFRVRVSGARWYQLAILNLSCRWWSLGHPRARAHGPALPPWVAVTWPPSAVELGGRARRSGRRAAAGMGFRRGHSPLPGAVLVGPIRVGRPTPASYTADWRSRVPRPTGPSSFRVQLLNSEPAGGP